MINSKPILRALLLPIVLTVLILLGYRQEMYAQSLPPRLHRIDSLMQSLNVLRGVTGKEEQLANTLVLLTWELRLTDAKKAEEYGREGIRIALEKHLYKLAAKGYNYLGVVHIQDGNMGAAIEQLFLALDVAEKHDIKDEVGYAFLNISLLYRTQGDLTKSKEFTFKSLEVFQDIQLASGLGYASLRLGDVYTDLSQHDSAFIFYKKAYEVRTLLKDSAQLISPLTLMGASKIALHAPAEGLQYLRTAYDLSVRLQLPVRSNEIQAYMLRGFSALKEHQKAVVLGEELWKHNQYGWYKIRELIMEGLVQAYTDEGRYKEALSMKNLLINLRDSLRSATVMRSLQRTDANYQLEKKELELELYKTRESNQQIIMILSIVGMIVLLLLVGVLLSRIKYRKEAQRTLQEKNHQLEEANQFRTGLLRMAAHDLKNPLTGILMSGEILPMIIESNPTQAIEFVGEIHRAAQRMLKLITDLLDVAREMSTIEIKTRNTDLIPLLESIVSQNTVQAEQKNITMTFSAPHIALADVDEERMIQVFENLISNAIKYTHTGGSVEIRVVSANIFVKSTTSPDKEQSHDVMGWKITVRDTGQGLHEDDLKNMFKPFQKLSSVPTANEHSTGVGLSIVKQIVTYHQGNVYAESPGKGKGTTFIVELRQTLQPQS